MFQRGVSPVRLSQLDVRPAVEAAQMVAAAKANLNSSINQSILDFAQKQQKKKQDKIGIKAIQNMYGLDDTTARAVYKDDVVRDAFVIKQKADAELKLTEEKAKNERLTKIGYVASQIEDPDKRLSYLESQGIQIPFKPLDFELSLDEVEQGVLQKVKDNPDDEDATKALYALGVPTQFIQQLLEEYRSAIPEEPNNKVVEPNNKVVETEIEEFGRTERGRRIRPKVEKNPLDYIGG